jgi:hypothetical protein
MPAESYFLIITDAEALLSTEDDGQFAVFLEILQKSADEWSGDAENSDELRRSAVRFCVIFQASEHASAEFESRLQLTGATYQHLVVKRSEDDLG